MNGTRKKRQEYIMKRHKRGLDTNITHIMRHFGVCKTSAYDDLIYFKKTLDEG